MTRTDRHALVEHRRTLDIRPELAAIYRGWFRRLLDCLPERGPFVEIGAGPGLLKSEAASVIATDVVPLPWIDLACDATTLPFRDASLGGLIMVDVIHHLARPVDFLREAARVLRPGGRIAAIEPWVSPASYFLYRFFHHESCRLHFDLERPFDGAGKRHMDGNAAIPRRLLMELDGLALPLRVVQIDRFLALPYLVSLGFKTRRRVPDTLVAIGGRVERAVGTLLARPAATRVLAVLERTGAPAPPRKG